METFNFVVANWETLFTALTSVVGAFALLSTLTPNETDNEIMNKIMKLVNFLGANFGKSENK